MDIFIVSESSVFEYEVVKAFKSESDAIAFIEDRHDCLFEDFKRFNPEQGQDEALYDWLGELEFKMELIG